MKVQHVIAGLCASVMVTVSVPIVSYAETVQNLEIKHIYYDNQLITSPYGFTYGNTDYMPIWYVMSTLDKEGFKHTWSNNVWNIIVPDGRKIDYSNIQYGKGSMVISINGKVVARVNGVTHVDPAAKAITTFMPIWYVEQALNRLGVQSTWDGNTWKMSPLSFKNVDLRYPAPSNITAQSIDSYLAKSPYLGTIGSPMTGLGESFIEA